MIQASLSKTRHDLALLPVTAKAALKYVHIQHWLVFKMTSIWCKKSVIYSFTDAIWSTGHCKEYKGSKICGNYSINKIYSPAMEAGVSVKAFMRIKYFECNFNMDIKAGMTAVFLTVILFVLRFYGPVNPMGSCRAQSVYLTTHLLGRLSPLSG